MLYLLGKILIWLLLAAVLGFTIGWYLSKFFMNKKTTNIPMNDSKNMDYHSTLQDENEKLKSELDRCLETAKNLQKRLNSSAAMEKDNLQHIRGIGKILELRLNQLGIYSFRQISNWDNTDIQKISKDIGPFRDRIVRDKWIVQAKELNNLKNVR